MRLHTLQLVNFQAHANTDVEFSPTITTIKGPTDRGKSSILRALRWVCLNAIAGDEFIREGEKKTSVTLHVKPGEMTTHEIVRSKNLGGGDNKYELDEEEFKAFGMGVPPDISDLLRLTELNFQGQHDSPFWFDETAGEVSRQLNAVIDLSVIDSTLSNIAHSLRQAQDRQTICEERLAEVNTELEEVVFQRHRIKQFRALKSKHEKLESVEARRSRLETILEKLRANQARWLETKADDGESLLEVARRAVSVRRKTSALEQIILEVGELRIAAQRPPDFTPVTKAFDVARDARIKAEQLDALIRRIAENTFAKDARSAAVVAAEERFHNKTEGMACPLCGQKITERV